MRLNVTNSNYGQLGFYGTYYSLKEIFTETVKFVCNKTKVVHFNLVYSRTGDVLLFLFALASSSYFCQWR